MIIPIRPVREQRGTMIEQAQQEEPNHTGNTHAHENDLYNRDAEDTASDSEDEAPLGVSRYDSDSDDDTNNGFSYLPTLYDSDADDRSSSTRSSSSSPQARRSRAD